jgi:hypothetical protein
MYDEIYLETDEEVTSAVEKIKKAKKKNVALCLPRNSVLGQSIVNLKLIFKEATTHGKHVGLVSPDKTTRNLAERIGFKVSDSPKDLDWPRGIDEPRVKKDIAPAVAAKTKDEDEEDEKESEESEDDDEEPASSSVMRSAGFTSQAVQPGSEEENDEPEAEQKPSAPIQHKESDLHAHHQENAQSNAGGSMIPTKGNLRFFRAKKKRSPLKVLALILAALMVALGAGVLTVPAATVKVTVKAQPLNEKVKSTVDTAVTELDAEKGILPGKLVSVEHLTKSSTKTTGKKDIGAKATGTVTIINEWDSQVHTFAAGSRVKAKNGNEFVLTDSVSVPGASSTVVGGKPVINPGRKDASVEAAAAGDTYNNAPTTFTIPSLPKAQQDKIYATSAAAFTGGTTNVVSVVSQADIDKVTEAIKNKNKEESIAKLKEQAGEGMIIVDKAIQTTSQDVSSSPAVDAQGDTVEATVTGKFQVISFSQENHKKTLEKLLEGKIPQGQTLVTEGEGVGMDTTQFELNLVSDTKLDLTNTIKAFTVTAFDQNAIRRAIIGAVPGEVNSIVEKKVPLDKIEMNVTPSWWPRLPLSGSRIKLEFAYVAK